MSYDVDEVLEFLVDWRSAKECKEKFELSDVQGVRMFRWLVKAGLVTCQRGFVEGADLKDIDGRVYYYKSKK